MADSLYVHEVTFIDGRSQEVRHQAMAASSRLELLPLDVMTCRLIGMKCLLRRCFSALPGWRFKQRKHITTFTEIICR